MNYSLSSSRKIGDYIQKIITTYNNTEKATSDNNVLAILKTWHMAFNDLNPPTREVGELEFKGFTETPSVSNDNLGAKADITFTVLSTYSYFPKTTTLKVNDITVTNLETALNTAFSTLTGIDTIKTDFTYIISAIINLH